MNNETITLATILRRIGFAPVFAEVVKCLGEYLKEFGTPISSSALNDFGQACKEYSAQMLKRNPKLRIAVAGKFSCGKSQFINSLTGYEIAAVDLARTTCCKTTFTGDSSANDIVILDASGKSVTRDEYVKLSAKKAATDQEFVVKIPNADWADFEIIDTPGYDSVEELDRQISEKAVNEADVVLFLFDMGNGTIPKDSIEYLKRVARSDQLFYLVANKADLKSEGARQTIIKSIAEECLRKDIKYECVLPYSSLTAWSKEILQKSEPMRTNVLKLAGRLKQELMEVVEKLVERQRLIRASKLSRLENDLRDRIEECWNKIGEAFSTLSYEKFLGYFAEAAPDTDDTVESVTNALMDFAAAFTSGVSTKFIHWHEVSGTGILWTNWENDWRVSLGEPTDEYDSLGQGAVSLLHHLMNVELGEYQLTEDLPARRLIDLIKPCSTEVIRQLINKGGYSERCIVKSKCRDAEGRIQERLNSEFPDVFHDVCRPKVAEVVEALKLIWIQKMILLALKPIVNGFGNVIHCLDAFGIDRPDTGDATFSELMSREVISTEQGKNFHHADDGSSVKIGDPIIRYETEEGEKVIDAASEGTAFFS